MDTKSIKTLEFAHILEKLEGYAAFSASRKLARSLRPTNDYHLAQDRLARTSEARRLLSEHAEVSVGSAHDIRPQVALTTRGGVLDIPDFIDIKSTLESARRLKRFFAKLEDKFPHLMVITDPMDPPSGLIEAISKVINEKGEIADNASAELSSIRSRMRTSSARLQQKLTGFISNPNTTRFLQEAIITQRNGRYVVPLRAEHKGRIKCVVQDQSASGSTLFVEPLEVVELNNTLLELQMAEKEEIRRILAELSNRVEAVAEELNTIVNALAVLDLALMSAKYAEDLQACEPILHHPNEVEKDNNLPLVKLLKARHPLIDPQKVVPIDLWLQNGVFSLVITGPNTGGKTVTLKTTGLLALMAQSGLHIPAQSGSALMLFRNIYADIGDEQSIEQSLSTFSGHITNIVRILKKARWNTLVLFDELGAGTDPQEGSALARAILQHMVQKSIPNLVATHYPELKAFAHTQPGVMNASMEFDLKTLKPTYRLLLGLPGRSNALSIASRLGMEEVILEDARTMLDPSELRTDDLLDEIHRQREIARNEREAAQQANTDAQEMREQLQNRLDAIEDERLRILEDAQKLAAQEIEKLRNELLQMQKQAQNSIAASPQKKEMYRKLDQLEEAQIIPIERKPTMVQASRPLKVGDRVNIPSLKVDGHVQAITQDMVEVQIGKMRIKVSAAEIARSKKKDVVIKKEDVEVSSTVVNSSSSASPGIECYLLGKRVDDAVMELERYIERAYAAGVPYVRIVHGKGTGTIRKVVRDYLGTSEYVERWEPALANEGGAGVTIAHMSKS